MPDLSRREFLKLGALSFGAFAAPDRTARLPPEDRVSMFGLGRVTADTLYIRKEPDRTSARVGVKRLDDLANLLEEIISPYGPEKNPRWYRVVGGFIHSGYVQRVERQLNPVLRTIPEDGGIAEITVPMAQSFRHYRTRGWQPLYRLYYRSAHWVTGLVEGPDGTPWYEITDDRLGVKYAVDARVMRPIPPEEITPLSPDVPPDEKRIVVSLAGQTVTCYEGDRPVFTTDVSTGAGGPTNNGIPRETPPGRFRIGWKMPVRHMGDGDLTHEPGAYELPGVPWCAFFVSTGVAFHGTYWHDNFGIPMSSGCVNMRPDEARWLFRWTMPEHPERAWFSEGAGTVVEVI